MTDAGLSSSEEGNIQQAADQAFRGLTSDETPPAPGRLRLSEALRRATRKGPVRALTIAFLLGVVAARRR
jgi:hypothetical protein